MEPTAPGERKRVGREPTWRSSGCLQRLHHGLVRRRKDARLQTREEGLPVFGHLERAASAGHELDVDVQLLFDRCGQTDRTGFVASSRAILDADGHIEKLRLRTPGRNPRL